MNRTLDHITERQWQRAYDRIRNGESERAVAASLGISRGPLWQRLRKNGIRTGRAPNANTPNAPARANPFRDGARKPLITVTFRMTQREYDAIVAIAGIIRKARRRAQIIFHGDDEKTHRSFQAWRQANVDGFHMTESAKGQFTIHYTEHKYENAERRRCSDPEDGRGCRHQGGSGIKYRQACYTKARKVCSNDVDELRTWAKEHGFRVENCKDCDASLPLEIDAPKRSRK